MNTTAKVFIILALVIAVGAVFAVKHYNASSEDDSGSALKVTDSGGKSQDTPARSPKSSSDI